MNEQELILKNKIEKREKFDIILAYILIVILVACIGIILYLKFIKEEESTLPEEYIPTYISLNEISTSLNNSLLINKYRNDGAAFSSNISGSSLVITYEKEEEIININIPTVGNELFIEIPEENTEIVTEIYKEITTIICKYYGNSENNCRNVVDSINPNNSIQGVRFVNNNIYIDTTKSIDVSAEIIYNEITKTSINNTNYKLNLLDTKISNISISGNDTNITFSGKIEKEDNNENLSVVVKLYDEEENIIGENKDN